MANKHNSSPLRYCFRASPTTTTTASTTAPPPPPTLATTLYQTQSSGLFALTWSRTPLTRSLHINFLLGISSSTEDAIKNLDSSKSSLLSNPAFTLTFKPFIFWCKYGFKKLNVDNTGKKKACVFWDFSGARFGSGPEPQSGFYIAVVIDGEMVLLVGDLIKEAYARTKARKQSGSSQSLLLRREHVHGNKLYRTRADFGGQERELSIDCRGGDDSRMYFFVDSKRVLKIKHLKWKFRGNERIEVDGVSVQVSWDVYNWLFEDDEEGYALFTFRFDKKEFANEDDYFNHLNMNGKNSNNGMIKWSQQSFGLGFETKKMRKGLLKSGRSSTSSSFSSASSSSSVMEWESLEENELKGPSGFSLMVYAWKN